MADLCLRSVWHLCEFCVNVVRNVSDGDQKLSAWRKNRAGGRPELRVIITVIEHWHL